MTITREELARRLRRAREACRLKQEDVAGRLGVSRSTIAQIEAGKRNVSSLELDRLAYLYGRDIRDLLAEECREEDTIVALFRSHPELVEQEPMALALRKTVALGHELANLERVLGLEREITAFPSYSLATPMAKWLAVRQGERLAQEERQRLGLGHAALPNVAELLESQGVRTAQLELPEDVSGLTLQSGEIGVFVVVNNLEPGHSRLRRRFSYAHEYCHALVDREQKGTMSCASDRDSLLEVRANAFAAAFLMPRSGVEEFVQRLGKGRPSRLHTEIYDGAHVQRVQGRPEPGSQAIQMHDVVLLAHHFGVSRLAALYRLKNLGFLTTPQFETLREREQGGVGKDLAHLLGLAEPDAEEARNEFRHRFLALALEAFRRDEITYAKLRELAGMVAVSPDALDATLAHGGFGDGEEERER